jgi:hypothetical protein
MFLYPYILLLLFTGIVINFESRYCLGIPSHDYYFLHSFMQTV